MGTDDMTPSGRTPEVDAELEAARTGPITVDITTTGRRSGEPRRIEIWIVNIDGMIVIAGTPGRRDWFANLSADPRLTVHFKETTLADVTATAHEVENPGHRRAIFEHPATRWYRQQTSVDDLVASGPTVQLVFDADR